jgi:monovalent cation:H+ antiporter, CPA1 family
VNSIEHPSGVIILLLATAVLMAIVANRLRIPYTIALVAAGLVVRATHALNPPELTQGLLYTIFLPGLLFEAAYHLDWREIRHNAVAVSALAVPGVVVSLFVTALIVTFASHQFDAVPSIPWRAGLVFGALIAATDPVAVVALVRRLGVPERLRMLVEAESVLNDGTAIVSLSMVLAIIGGAAVSAGALAANFAVTVGMGVLVGVAVGGLASIAIRWLDDPVLEITVTSVAAYGSFVAADIVHGSGVLATVAAGLLCGNYAAPRGMSAASRHAVTSFWDYVAFVLNSLVFLLLGASLHPQDLVADWPLIAVAFVAVLIARGAVILGVSAFVDRTGERIPRSWQILLTWGGIRGALSMVLALDLPHDVPARAAVVTMTIGVVTLSIILQGGTMIPLLRVLKLSNSQPVKAT